MKLTVGERVVLGNILPPQGNAATLRIIMDLGRQLSFTEEELEHYNIKNNTLPDGRTTVTWNPELAKETKDIKIGKAARGIIVKQLKQLDSQNQLHITMLPIYEKFVEGTEEAS